MRICCSELGVNLPQMLDSLRYLRRSIQAMPYSVIASMRHRTGKAPVQFVIEDADWAIRWVGEGIRNGLPAYARGKMGTTCTPYNLTHQIAHFGSQYMWVDWASHISKTNRTIASFFHGKPEDGPAVEKHIELFLKHEPQLSRIVVSAAAVGERLKAWGVCTAKISHIPIGTDVGLFVPPSFQQREEARKKLGFSPEAIVIGSFQKDGVGWGKGLRPKLIKGPDLFLDVVENLSSEYPIEVLLSGPARGYVKYGLESKKIPYRHMYPSTREGLVDLYHALDVYLMTSREEGGPMALIESMSAGIPVVSTRAGMAVDLIQDGTNGFLTDLEDVDGLVDGVRKVLALGEEKRMCVAAKARAGVQACDWSVVALRHWEEVYKPLLNESA